MARKRPSPLPRPDVRMLWTNRGPVAERQMTGQSLDDHKGFLRMRLARDGTLTLYRWRSNGPTGTGG